MTRATMRFTMVTSTVGTIAPATLCVERAHQTAPPPAGSNGGTRCGGLNGKEAACVRSRVAASGCWLSTYLQWRRGEEPVAVGSVGFAALPRERRQRNIHTGWRVRVCVVLEVLRGVALVQWACLPHHQRRRIGQHRYHLCARPLPVLSSARQPISRNAQQPNHRV